MPSKRKSIPEEVKTRVMVACRRRCCLCWHLNRDDSVKRGQIAHLDQDHANPAESNLVFMCHEHHDMYDTKSKQAKSISIGEVRHALAELKQHLDTSAAASTPPAPVLTPSEPAPSPAPAIDQRGQVVHGSQSNWNVGPGSKIQVTNSDPQAAAGAPESGAASPGRRRTKAKAKRDNPSKRSTASRSTKQQPAAPPPFASNLPDRLYIVFCRICGLGDFRVDELAGAQHALMEVAQGIADEAPFGGEVEAVRPSVYGRILFIRNPVPAMDAATMLLERCAARGVHLAIGITVGRLEKVESFGEWNLNGPEISHAARLAALDKAAERVVVSVPVFQAASVHSTYASHRFEGPLTGKVKRTNLRYYLLLHTVSRYGPPQPSPKHRSFDAHVVVFDIARFSEKDADTQWSLVTELRRRVEDELQPLHGTDRAKAGQLWYAPAGDGGVLVFSTDSAGGKAALRLAQGLADACRPQIEIRLGIATGSVVVLPGQLPVGTGVLEADKLCGFPASWQICVNRAFWEPLRDSTPAWRTAPVTDEPDALLLFPRPPDRDADREGPPQPDPKPTPPPHAEGDTNPFVWQEIRKLLDENPRLSTEVLSALDRGAKEDQKTLAVLAGLVHEEGLLEALRRVRTWLIDQRSVGDTKAWETLVWHLASLGVRDVDWLQSMRGRLSEAQVGRLLELAFEEIEVPGTVWPFAAELYVAAVKDRPTQYKPDPSLPPSAWSGVNHVELISPEDLSSPSDLPSVRLRELVKRILHVNYYPVFEDHARNLETLKEFLHERDPKERFYAIYRDDEPLFKEPLIREMLLLLRCDPSDTRRIDRLAGIPEVLRQLLKKLRELK